MINIILLEPEIPPNTGNIIRLCANTGFKLHLIKPLGFSLDNKQLRRAGLDYRDLAEVQIYDSLAHFCCELDPLPNQVANQQLGQDAAQERLFACSTRAQTRYTEPRYQAGDCLLFGPETRGLPADVLAVLPESRKIRIPMQSGSRSLNLSNAVAIIAYEAWRQLGF